MREGRIRDRLGRTELKLLRPGKNLTGEFGQGLIPDLIPALLLDSGRWSFVVLFYEHTQKAVVVGGAVAEVGGHFVGGEDDDVSAGAPDFDVAAVVDADCRDFHSSGDVGAEGVPRLDVVDFIHFF